MKLSLRKLVPLRAPCSRQPKGGKRVRTRVSIEAADFDVVRSTSGAVNGHTLISRSTHSGHPGVGFSVDDFLTRDAFEGVGHIEIQIDYKAGQVNTECAPAFRYPGAPALAAARITAPVGHVERESLVVLDFRCLTVAFPDWVRRHCWKWRVGG